MEQTYQGVLDEFAGRAMQAIMTTEWYAEEAGGDRSAGSSSLNYCVARMSYEQALEMMTERDRRIRITGYQVKR